MPFDFSNYSSEIVTEFWVYIIATLALGILAGWGIRVVLTKTARENFRSEKERLQTDKEAFQVDKNALIEKYEDLCKNHEELMRSYEDLKEKQWQNISNQRLSAYIGELSKSLAQYCEIKNKCAQYPCPETEKNVEAALRGVLYNISEISVTLRSGCKTADELAIVDCWKSGGA